MKLNYKERLFLYFSLIFALFTTGIVLFEQAREKKFKTEALEEKLSTYAEIANAALVDHHANNPSEVLDSLIRFFPQTIRLSLIDKQGNVRYDNSITDLSELQNHAQRPEIAKALIEMKGSDIRTSASTNEQYLYFAKKYRGDFIRVALPYDIQTQRFLKGDNLFLYFILLFFIAILVVMNVVASRFGKSINRLRNFVVSSDKDEAGSYLFPNDELGEIGAKITENYLQIKESKRIIDAERKRLLQHIHSSEEGICFFTENRKTEFYNGLFIQYLNTLTNEPNSEPYAVLTDDVFEGLHQFLASKEASYYETHLSKQGKTFSLRVNIFEDKGFEIVLNDITKQEKTRQLKQEMTGNIAHELRTPVTSIRGYLETVLEQELGEEQRRYFITQAHNQTIVLSELIQDMGLITKIEEAPQSFKLEHVNLNQLLEALENNYSLSLRESNIKMYWKIPKGAEIMGNRNLLYAVFRNLVDNTIRYAGKHLTININLYKEDLEYFYFSYSDTGTGIQDEKHFSRLFERFYRINEGRTRDTGGSGLGLSIVRNAVAFHKGSIVAKNKQGAGLEFLFQLHR